jgi:hypothetical protein
MRMHHWRTCLVVLTVFFLSLPAAEAQTDPLPEVTVTEAETVVETQPEPIPAPKTFIDVRDAVPGKFFDAEATTIDPADPNRLIVGFNSGTDPNTWQATEFRAATGAFNLRNVMDTLQFTVVAPEGYYVESITYTQRGAGSVLRSGGAHGSSSWIVGGKALPLRFFGSNPSVSGTADLSEMRWSVVPVAITTSLSAFSPPALGSASVAITFADVVVTFAKIE